MRTIRNMPVSRLQPGDRVVNNTKRQMGVVTIERDSETGDYVITDPIGDVEYFDGAARVTVYRD